MIDLESLATVIYNAANAADAIEDHGEFCSMKMARAAAGEVINAIVLSIREPSTKTVDETVDEILNP